MSDKLTEDFDIFYVELENFTNRFKTSSQQIETDKMLSRSGKHEKSELLKAEHLKNINDLGERFQIEFDKRVLNIENSLNGKKKNAVLDSIKERFSKGESLSGDETNRLLLSEMQENKTIMKKSSFQNMLANADEKQIRKTAQSLSDGSDIEKLEWLQELASLRGNDMISNSLAGQIDGIKDANLNDEQRNLKGVSERIQKGVKLFQYSLERSKRGDFIDARQDEV